MFSLSLSFILLIVTHDSEMLVHLSLSPLVMTVNDALDTPGATEAEVTDTTSPACY